MCYCVSHAETWLLEALPGIGAVKAKAIVAYRQQNGDFHNTLELTNVDGISPTLYGQIKDLVTVTD
jgi:competence protein ComEA